MIDMEAFEERAAIMEFDAGMSREVAEKTALQHMLECEVRDVIKRFYPDGAAAKEYLDACEKKRGKDAADRLRDAVRAEWRRKKEAA